MTDDIVHEATYPHPPAAVWRALTDPKAVSAWLMVTDDLGEPRVGQTFHFRDKPRPGWSGVTVCKILEVVPERRIVYDWADPDDVPGTGTRVSWELEPTATGGTRLRFRHAGFHGVKGWLMRAGMNKGWWRMVHHGIPYVVERMAKGSVPSRDETKAHAKAAKAA